jgi:arabinofuranosyltransferase
MIDAVLTRAAAPFSRENSRTILAALIFLTLVMVVRVAWISDDALITVRCILNLLHGYGPVFNIDERVQAFTHPLWFLCAALATKLLVSPWIALLVLSMAAPAATLRLLFFRLGESTAAGIAACVLLLLSKAFLDYSTSGLETPLTNVLILAVLASGARRLRADVRDEVSLCPLWFGLLYLNRADTVLLLAPFVAVVMARRFTTRRALVISLAIAAMPVAAWTIFSLLYYGFLVPNTAFAKLGGAIPRHERLLQGCIYMLDSLGRDAVTLPAILAGIVLGLRRGLHGVALAFGMLVYLIYVVLIGGDQMSGRFLVAPLIISAGLVAQTRGLVRRHLAFGGCLVVLGLVNLPATWLADTQMPLMSVSDTGIADERAVFFHAFGLVRAKRYYLDMPPPWPRHLTAPSSVKVIECGGLGVTGIKAGPDVHIIDQCGLADPLLARLPAVPNPEWRIAHLVRNMPDKYQESVAANADEITDPAIAKLYGRIRLITRGPIFAPGRMWAILAMNLGF